MHSKVEEAWGKGRLEKDRIGIKVYNCIHQVFQTQCVEKSHENSSKLYFYLLSMSLCVCGDKL